MKVSKVYLFFIGLLFFISCSKKDEVPGNVQVQSFVWKGLNAYYLWQGEISDLSDRRFTSDQQLYSYLSGFEDPNTLFESLLYQRNVVDKWSWIVDDYIALEQAFQGTTLTTGMEFGLVRYKTQTANVFGYVRYVVPGTDAETQGVTRGMIFNQVNGVQLTDQNYRSLLFSDANSYTIGLADYNNGDPIANSTTITLTKSSYTENPVYIAKTLDVNGQKIGYLMYNSFTANFDAQLNQAFAQFKADNVTNLIIDLRYNGGGSVRTATRLGSMVTGQFNGEVFAKQLWNNKYMSIVNPESLIDRFPDVIDNNVSINSLNLTSVYFITTNNSASASELVINSLLPYIDVKTVGTTTHGKYVGSITLYDSPTFYSKKDINPNHNWAMQPIVLEIVNKDNQNQKNGIDPNVEIRENYGDLGILGDVNEPLLKRTIEYITTGSRGGVTVLPFTSEVIDNSKSGSPTYNNMYVTIKRD
ncbi:S41 family peptidase [Tenacibaculum sp. TC6]|uniref:S41 family peptidase n=1 Tax=Tenacibaculum sp. TC6 TaxID=3423223 RepID=UPI003D36CEB5